MGAQVCVSENRILSHGVVWLVPLADKVKLLERWIVLELWKRTGAMNYGDRARKLARKVVFEKSSEFQADFCPIIGISNMLPKWASEVVDMNNDLGPCCLSYRPAFFLVCRSLCLDCGTTNAAPWFGFRLCDRCWGIGCACVFNIHTLQLLTGMHSVLFQSQK